MDLVDEQDGGLAGVFEAVIGGGEDAAHVRDIRFHTTEAFELGLGLVRDDLGERRFACAGRSVKNQRLNPVGLDRAAE